jgi:hypothetical protein
MKPTVPLINNYKYWGLAIILFHGDENMRNMLRFDDGKMLFIP